MNAMSDISNLIARHRSGVVHCHFEFRSPGEGSFWKLSYFSLLKLENRSVLILLTGYISEVKQKDLECVTSSYSIFLILLTQVSLGVIFWLSRPNESVYMKL